MAVKGKKAGAPLGGRQVPQAGNVKTVTPINPEPKNKRLPGMEDPEIEELQSAAEEYAGIRDQRMALTKKEVPRQEKLLQIMKKHGRKHYNHAGVEATLIVEKEKVKVKIHRGEKDE
jgi:hypothetical protein